MSIRQGKKLIASSTTNGFNLFDCKWADHILNNISWLRADTFSWQSGDVYVAAYEHLVGDYENTAGGMLYAWNNGAGSYVYTLSESPSVGDSVYDSLGVLDSSRSVINVENGGIYVGEDEVSSLLYTRDSSRDTKIPQTDTIGDITITYYLSEDGHKICLPDQESNLVALYNKTGVAWYYILDVTNKQFKLPRTKWGFTGIRSGVGGYVAPGLPNITGSFSTASDKNLESGAFSWTTNKYSTNGGGKGGQWGINFSAKKSNSIYGNSTTVQPPATQMYLYFYVGNFVEDITTIDAGKLAEVVNDFDIDTFKPQVNEAKNSAITGINDAKTDAIGSLTNLATDLGTSLKYGNVGDIFYTSRLDVSLNGAVECNGNLYNTTDFSGAQSIGNLLRDSKVPYISLAEHQTTVDTYGSCRCFGWDGGTEFRVPKLADVFIEAGVAASEGEFISAGLPNITGTFQAGSGTYTAKFNNLTGAFGSSATGTGRDVDGGSSTATTIAKFDASKSNSIYGRSTTVQPPAVRYRAMVQLAFGATDDAVVTAGNVVADVSELNSHRVIAFQAPTSANGYTWYRKYADGWVEQGGRFSSTATNSFNAITIPVAMRDTNYSVFSSNLTDYEAGTGSSHAYVMEKTASIYNLTTTTIGVFSQNKDRDFVWQVSGMSAQ